MTDWLAWLLEALKEEEDREEDLDLREYVLPGGAENQAGETAGPWRGAPAESGGRGAGVMEEDRAEGSAGQGEDEELPLLVRELSEARLAQVARQAGSDPSQPWQRGSPAGTGEVRSESEALRWGWTPGGGGAAPAGTAAVDLETAVRRARAAVEQARGLGQAEPVVLRKPEPVRQNPAPLELDRIFQRDARRYDGGFTLF